MGFVQMVPMARSPAEKAEEAAESMMPPAIADMPDVPYGLHISLTEEELEKLDLSDDAEVGDMIHLMAMATITSISKNQTSGGCKCRIELAITHLAVEDEDKEDEEEAGEDG